MMLGFYMVLFEIESAAGSKKKTCKNEESQQKFGSSYFVRALEEGRNFHCNGSPAEWHTKSIKYVREQKEKF